MVAQEPDTVSLTQKTSSRDFGSAGAMNPFWWPHHHHFHLHDYCMFSPPIYMHFFFLLCSWAKLDAPPDWPAEDHLVHKMVINIGVRPTVNMGHDVTVECHILHQYTGDFYGQNLRVVMLGYLRPEAKFSSIDELVARIAADKAIASFQLDNTELRVYKSITLLGGPRKS